VNQDQRIGAALQAEAERAASIGTWSWNIASGEVYWSDNMYRILGYEPGEITPSLELWGQAIHPQDLERVQEMMQVAQRTAETPPMEYRILTSTGTVKYLLAHGGSVTDEAGELVRQVGTVVDLTERVEREAALRRSEALFAETQSMARIGAWEWRPSIDYLYYSDQLREIFGMGPEDEPDIMLFEALVHPEDRARVRALREEALRTGVSRPVDCRLLLADGRVRHIHTLARDHTGPDGVPFHTGAIVDVTERVQLEAQLRHAQVMESVGQLASGIAHDFNNLLTVVLANAAVLSEGSPSPELSAIVQAAESGAKLTRGLLAAGRRADLEIAPLELDSLVTGGVEMLRHVLGSLVQVRLDTQVSEPVLADAQHLQQILLNLVLNARDALEGAGEIRIQTRIENGRALVLVQDDGVGMDAATLASAFDPFFTTKSESHGSGLGLSMVRGLVEQMGGRIRLDSQLGQGTTAHLSLPLAEKPVANPGERPAEQPQGRHVLVVEDEPAVRNLVVRVLNRAGYKVAAAARPSEAILLMARESFDLVLSDISMPEGGGRQVLADLAEHQPQTPTLLMTGYNPHQDWMSGPILRKPFAPRELLQAVAAALVVGDSAL
jgi:PAS domain S-box-containing protein